MRNEIIDIHNAPKEEVARLGEFIEYVRESACSVNTEHLIYLFDSVAGDWVNSDKTGLPSISIVDFLNKHDRRLQKKELHLDNESDEFIKASPEDIVVGNIIYIFGDDKKFVEMTINEVYNPTKLFKAFLANDGCRYGLDGSYIKTIVSTCSGEFNGGFIENSEEALELLKKSGHKFGHTGTTPNDVIVVSSPSSNLYYSEIKHLCNHKQFYINKGKLSWDKPEEYQKCKDCGDLCNHDDDAINQCRFCNAVMKEPFTVAENNAYGLCTTCSTELGEVAYTAKHADGSFCSVLCADKADAKMLAMTQKPLTVAENESDGGRNNFYTFPKWVYNIDKLCRYLKLTSAEGNILKSLTISLGARHGATDVKREVKKCLYYVIERMQWNDFSDEEIMAQVKKHLDDARNGS